MVKLPLALTANWNKAKLAGTILKDSVEFNLRRRKFRSWAMKQPLDAIIVDMDGTVFHSDANLEALRLLFPKKVRRKKTEGQVIYESVIDKILAGMPLEKAVLESHSILIRKDFSIRDIQRVLNLIKPKIRIELIVCLKEIKRVTGVPIILATLSSREFARMLNAHLAQTFDFRFDGVVGTELHFDKKGYVIAIKDLIGKSNYNLDGVRVRTKLRAIQDHFAAQGDVFDPNRAMLITDSYADIDLSKEMLTVLIKPRKSLMMAQTVSQRLRLADFVVREGPELLKKMQEIVFKRAHVEPIFSGIPRV